MVVSCSRVGKVEAWKSPRRGTYGIAVTPSNEIWYAALSGDHIGHVNRNTGDVEIVEPPRKGMGPRRTTLAQALQDMACERLPFMKGAAQEARRINVYLRAAGLATLTVSKCSAPTALPDDAVAGQAQGEPKHFEVTLLPATPKRAIPRGEIDSHGAVAAVQILGGEGSSRELDSCYSARLRSWRFPQALLQGDERLLVNFVL